MAVKKATVDSTMAKVEAAKAEVKKEAAPAKAAAKKAAPAKKEAAPAKEAAKKAAPSNNAAPDKKSEPAKKAAPAKKATPAKAATENVVIEFAGGQVATSDIVAKAVEVSGKKSIKVLNVYYQPETSMVYFTADGEEGSFKL
ncbi:MAG: hypothetical protein J6P57_08700 [Lachnospiraceae bacterium]|nr:hypothetical protein [Lachnospiraceae bacterium]